MKLEKIKTVTCMCKNCGTTVMLTTKTLESIDDIRCSICNALLSSYTNTFIKSALKYNETVEELQSATSTTGFLLNKE